MRPTMLHSPLVDHGEIAGVHPAAGIERIGGFSGSSQ
jgi:hypothetical protein